MAKEKKEENKKTTILTPVFRVSFPQLFKPRAFGEQEAKYSITMLFPKDVDISELKKAAFKAAQDEWGPKDKRPKKIKIKWPWKDGDEKSDLEGYEGMISVKASSKQKVGLLNKDKTPISAEMQDDEGNIIRGEEVFYAGCYARATLRAYAYEYSDPKTKKTMSWGISFGLQNVMKIKEGEPFSGKAKAEDDFADVEAEDNSEDETNYESEEEGSEESNEE